MSASIENSLKDISRSLSLIAKELRKMNNPISDLKPVQFTEDLKPISDNPYQE